MKASFVDRLVYWAARLAIGAAARVPQWLGYTAADLLGRLWFVLDRRRRRYALTFLRQAFPTHSDRELRRIGSASTGNLFKVPLDMARLTRLLARGGDLRQVLDDAPARRHLERMPKPFLGLTGHLGNWEVAAIGVAQFAGGAHGVARVSRNPLLQQWILHNRQQGGLVVHPRRGGIRGLQKAMAAGGVGLQVVDQNQRLRGVFAPFFGETASCERAAVSLALRRDYPLVVGAALREGNGFRFRLVLSEPFHLQRTGDKNADLYAAVVAVNTRLEALIRQAPEQYLWIHDRYRTKPAAGDGQGADDAAAEDAADDDGPA